MDHESNGTHQNEQKIAPNNMWAIVYVISCLLFVFAVARFYQPNYGFTSLLLCGDRFGNQSVAGLGCYIEHDSIGADGQFYAKLALDPLLRNPTVLKEIDSPCYRGRRILLSWTAWLIGLARPSLILQVFALQNVLCWLVLAWLLAGWFPPDGFNNYLRWAGVMFSGGLLVCVRCSFTDGPALLLVGLAMKACEQGKPAWATVALASVGLARETSLLAISAMIDPARRSARDLGKLALRVLVIILPLACWMLYLKLHVARPLAVAGVNNFDIPFAGFLRKWWQVVLAIRAGRIGHPTIWHTILVMIGLTVQMAFMFVKADWKQPWWRLGVSFAVLMIVLGDAVWEGFPGAAYRVILPMTLAFNVLVPRDRRWLAILIMGNLSVICALSALTPPRTKGPAHPIPQEQSSMQSR